ncbi:uncharacterized protein LTR77_002355 [Saxophila tyrrhenica]|uniref:Sulfotransferase n=1 Tax=Saxophila tyrrhenica TaxID=1690608 RepID=A0AAV9PIY2_9PEZI|nr:hypothetical protein LTR77_002355 [Saxophila tyrrhenica]
MEDRDSKKQPGLQVIGAGLPRTGTNSLMKALEILGYGPCHHTETLVGESYPYRNSRQWQKAMVTEDRETRQKILRGLYENGGFRSGCDYPTALFVDDLVHMYPNAKFIHGVRSSPAAWRASVNSTIALTHSKALYYACYLFPPMRLNLHPTLCNGQICERRRHGGVDVFEPSDSVEIYHRHNDWVRRIVPRERLLEFNPADGWKPLCKFLGVPVPRDGEGMVREYPRTNDKAQYRSIWRVLMVMGLMSWAVLFGAVYWAVRLLVR